MDLYRQNKDVKSVEFRAQSFYNVMKRIVKEMRQTNATKAIVEILEWDEDYKAFAQADYGIMTVKMTPMGPVYYWDNRDTIFYENVEMGIVNPNTGVVSEIRKTRTRRSTTRKKMTRRN